MKKVIYTATYIRDLIAEGKIHEAKLSDFDKFRFEGLGVKDRSNQYWEIDRVNHLGNKIIVKVDDVHIFPTKYGYGLRLDDNYVVWLKDWQVNINYYGTEVLLTEQYFIPKEFKSREYIFDEVSENRNWNTWLSIANEQQAQGNLAWWKKDGGDSKPNKIDPMYL